MLALRVERELGAAHEVERVDHDPRPGQLGANRLPVSLGGIDRDDLDRSPPLVGERAQPALHHGPRAPVEDLDHRPAVEIRGDRGQLAAAPVVGLVEREATGRPPLAPLGELVGGVTKGALNLIARGPLAARHFGVGGAADDPLAQPRR